ncbi:hypothetical protein MHYP_G00209520 [Metynnis hypsauchen]
MKMVKRCRIVKMLKLIKMLDGEDVEEILNGGEMPDGEADEEGEGMLDGKNGGVMLHSKAILDYKDGEDSEEMTDVKVGQDGEEILDSTASVEDKEMPDNENGGDGKEMLNGESRGDGKEMLGGQDGEDSVEILNDENCKKMLDNEARETLMMVWRCCSWLQICAI